MYLSCRIFGRVCKHGFAINDRASWLGGVVEPRSAGLREGVMREREGVRERRKYAPASTKSNSKRYKIVAAAVTDTRYDDDDNDVQFCFVFNYRNNDSYSYNTLLYFIDNVVESIEFLPADEKHNAAWCIREYIVWYKEVLMYTHKLYYVIICTYITCDIITCIVVSSGAAVDEWMNSTGEWKNKRESQRVTKRRSGMGRERDGQTDRQT